jgi:hypothetical protein
MDVHSYRDYKIWQLNRESSLKEWTSSLTLNLSLLHSPRLNWLLRLYLQGWGFAGLRDRAAVERIVFAYWGEKRRGRSL